MMYYVSIKRYFTKDHFICVDFYIICVMCGLLYSVKGSVTELILSKAF